MIKKFYVRWECPDCGTRGVETTEFIMEPKIRIPMPKIRCPCGRKKDFKIKDIFVPEEGKIKIINTKK